MSENTCPEKIPATLAQDSDDDDDPPRLCPETLSALQEFLQERMQEMELQSNVRSGDPETESNIFAKDMAKLFPEDWQMSQFWYDDETSNALAGEVLRLGGKAACLSCPSVFRACNGAENVFLFEYDRRFQAFGKLYHFYDYNKPENLREEFTDAFDVVIADPPFLSEECLSKLAQAVKIISKPNAKVILCTGDIMKDCAQKLLEVKKTEFLPKHAKNLGNEFSCFTNYDFPLKTE